MKRLLTVAAAAITLALSGSAALDLSHPEAAHAATSTPKRVKAFNFAKSQAGKPYCYGGEGSKTKSASCYDCSGLVQTAYAHAGISLPRTADEQVASSKVTRITKANAKDGDLVAWGNPAYHVEFVDRVGSKVYRYGASNSHTKIKRQTLYGTPRFFHVKSAG